MRDIYEVKEGEDGGGFLNTGGDGRRDVVGHNPPPKKKKRKTNYWRVIKSNHHLKSNQQLPLKMHKRWLRNTLPSTAKWCSLTRLTRKWFLIVVIRVLPMEMDARRYRKWTHLATVSVFYKYVHTTHTGSLCPDPYRNIRLDIKKEKKH